MKLAKILAPFLFCLLIVSASLLHADDSGRFKIVLLPDTQNYTRNNTDGYYAQTEWIAENAKEISFVLHQGDITNNNTPVQWCVAAFSMELLEGKVPYVLALGNHDIGPKGSSGNRDSTLANRFFPFEKYSKQKGFGGAFESNKIENVWFAFKAGGVDWLVLSLEFAPRNRVLDWAAKIIDRHPKHKVILNTHAYTDVGDKLLGPKASHPPNIYGIGKATGEDAANDGEMMWDKFVSKYPNMMFVFSGHVVGKGVGKVVSKGKHGNTVYQILANYQMRPQGGEGYLRIMTFDTKKGTVDVKTYSPFLDKYLEEPDHRFVFENVDFRFAKN